MHLCAARLGPLAENKEEDDVALHILALAIDSDTMLPDDTRAAIVDDLPEYRKEIAAYWRNRPAAPVRTPPSRREDGRNEPCPCGSGKKYKKCCGASNPPTLH